MFVIHIEYDICHTCSHTHISNNKFNVHCTLTDCSIRVFVLFHYYFSGSAAMVISVTNLTLKT